MYNSFIDIFYNTAIEQWNNEVIRDYSGSTPPITYRRLCSKIMEYQVAWRRWGLKQGDKIAICSNSSAEWACLFMAIQVSGYVAVCLSNDLHSSFSHIEHSDCSILYVDPISISQIEYPQMSKLIAAISIKDNSILWARHTLPSCVLLKKVHPQDFKLIERRSEDIALIIYTSGSTNNIKGVMLTIGNLSANLNSIQKTFPYIKHSNYLSVLPFYHIFGLMYDMLMPICFGLHLYILYSPPVPSILFKALQSVNPIMFFAVPIVFYKAIEDIIQKNGDKLSQSNVDEKRALVMNFFGKSCKYLITGGAAVNNEWLKSVYETYDLPFYIGYGMSECAASVCLPQLNAYRRYSCGKPIDEIDFKIMSRRTESIPGEILLRGEVVFKGYYKDEALTKSVIDQDGWFHTNDLAIMSKNSDVFIVGRMNDMYVAASGENIYLGDIEAELIKINGVLDAVVTISERFLIAYIVKSKEFSKEQISNSILDINSRLDRGTYIQEIKWIDKVERTTKGTIKRHLYL